MITFSILVPAYKSQFLSECIDSILAQTYKHFELVIVNDASPYDIDSIVSAYSDPRIRYYKNIDGYGAERLVDNWNHCLEYATGEYVMCMGDDDKLLPSCLEDYASFICLHPNLNVYHSRTLYIDHRSIEKKVQAVRPAEETVYSSIWHRLSGYYRFSIGEYLFNTKQLRDNKGFYYTPMAWAADDLTVWKLSVSSNIGNIPTPGFMFRDSSQSISGNSSGCREKIQALLMLKKWIKEMEDVQSHSALDQFYKERIPSAGNLYVSVFCKHLVCDDIVAHPINGIRYWLRNKKIDEDISISSGEIIHYFFISLKHHIYSKFYIIIRMVKNTPPLVTRFYNRAGL